MNNSIKMLSPFVLYCQKVIPLAFDESMSYYECLCALYSYLKDTVVPAVNNNAEALEEVQKAMTELKEYVDNYFENLDVQDEINNKLDEMAESGQLAEIIAQFLEMQFIYGFDTIANMKSGDSYVEGSIIRVLGKTSYSTGDGSYYRVRALTSSDVIDEDNIVALTNFPTLIAEKIQDYNINQINNELTNLDSRLDELEKSKKYVFVGDSYGTGWSPDSVVDGWCQIAANILGLPQSQYVIHAKGGVAMDSANFAGNTFAAYIQSDEFVADNDVTDVVIGGGYNDINQTATDSTIRQGLINVINACSTKYPNAKIHVAFIGNTNLYNDKYKLIEKVSYYINACNEFGVDYIANSEYALHDYDTVFSSDGIHPNLAGETAIAEIVAGHLKNGYANVSLPAKDINPTWAGLRTRIDNNITTFEFNGGIWAIGVQGGSNYFCNGQTPLNIIPVTSGYIIGTTNRTIRVPVEVVAVLNGSSFINLTGTLAIEEGYLRIYIPKINSAGNDYDTLNITSLQILPFNHSFNSLEC